MKQSKKIALTAIALFLGMAVGISSCKKDGNTVPVTGAEKSLEAESPTVDCGNLVNPADTIYQFEIDMLKYMREEEKLARDVYTAFSEQYTLPVFRNIARSEQYHMDRVLCLLEHYGIEDPASPVAGIFNNEELQELYNNLTEQGSASLVDALRVGATIEDVDIYDLEESIGQTQNEAIIDVFSRLSCASGNHLRSFTALLSKNGVTYVPQYISEEEYNGIILSDYEYCGCLGQ